MAGAAWLFVSPGHHSCWSVPLLIGTDGNLLANVMDLKYELLAESEEKNKYLNLFLSGILEIN